MSVVQVALIVRVLIAIFTRTFFQPDEYFQALEPAHHLVFGYGHLTWEWRVSNPIRSIVYPSLNGPVFWALKASGVSEINVLGPWLLVVLPRVLHGVLGAITDICSYNIARRFLGPRYATATFLLSLTSFFNALALTRSLSNSLETSISSIAYMYYPWDASPRLSPQLIYHKPNIIRLIIFSGLACVIRPTNAVIWVFLYANLFWSLKGSRRTILSLVWFLCLVGGTLLSAMVLLDSLFYKEITFTSINFLYTNLSRVSTFYGHNPWHYYFSQGIPILVTTALPFVVGGGRKAFSMREATLRNMLFTVVWTVSIYSLAGHKEWRFIHPILPLLLVLASKSLVDINEPVTKVKITANKKAQSPVSLHSTRSFIHSIRRSHLALLALPIPAALYVVLFYCSAPITVMSYIRTLPSKELQEGVGFLMPCHSTPGHAYLHRPELAKSMWALGCEPPLERQNLSEYHDQTDVFYISPKAYLEHYFPTVVNASFPLSPLSTSIPGAPAPHRTIPPQTTHDGVVGYPWRHEWPRRLVFFGSLLGREGVRELLISRGYVEEWKRGREWEGEGNRKGGVRVWKWDATH
ncbi:glycosyltransferase family 22 protein [Pluteus cervinus]|uniref:Glycosyltransferase family 22 protein n=1 Tax=Pluteus cervinus TaxID=181527 RepID=A0ACD3BED2_9AGAR|nr:glycosyltransferase family 22 protein [Pluteus cervinus]